ncbi:21140_t:CDS:2, partial [Racocetra persica]
FGIAFEGVLRDLGAVKINKEKLLNLDQIKDNIEKLKDKLNRDLSSLYKHLYSGMVKKSVEELSWKNSLASQVISDKSDIVKNLPRDIKKGFNKISRNIVLAQRPIVQELCREFIKDFRRNFERSKKYLEYKPEVAKTLNEGTYQSTVIVLLIQVALKNLPVKDSFFISTSEKQSIASTNRKGERTDDKIKLCQKVNDGLYWVRQSLNPDKEQFGIENARLMARIAELEQITKEKNELE